MNLRDYFGSWSTGMDLEITQSQGTHTTTYFSKLTSFSDDNIEISQADTHHPFNFSLVAHGSGENAPTFSFDLRPGSGIAPSYYSAENLSGTTLVSPPYPLMLIIQGEMTFSSNTLITTVNGRINFSKVFGDESTSEINLVILDRMGQSQSFNIRPSIIATKK